MSMLKIITYLFIATFVFLIGKIIIQEFFDNRPFKFEKYKSTEVLKEAVRKKYSTGGSLIDIRSDMENSGAKCYIYPPSTKRENCEVVLYCEYNTRLLSFHPFEGYRVGFDGDNNYKLIAIDGYRIAGMAFISSYIP